MSISSMYSSILLMAIIFATNARAVPLSSSSSSSFFNSPSSSYDLDDYFAVFSPSFSLSTASSVPSGPSASSGPPGPSFSPQFAGDQPILPLDTRFALAKLERERQERALTQLEDALAQAAQSEAQAEVEAEEKLESREVAEAAAEVRRFLMEKQMKVENPNPALPLLQQPIFKRQLNKQQITRNIKSSNSNSNSRMRKRGRQCLWKICSWSVDKIKKKYKNF